MRSVFPVWDNVTIAARIQAFETISCRFFHPITLRLRKGLVAFGPTAN